MKNIKEIIDNKIKQQVYNTVIVMDKAKQEAITPANVKLWNPIHAQICEGYQLIVRRNLRSEKR